MTGCGFKNNLFKSLLEKHYFIAHGGDFAGCLLLFTRRYCVRLRKGTGAGRSCCLSSFRPDGTGPRSSGRLRFCGKRGPAPFSCSTLLPGPSLRFSRLFDDPGLGDFYGWALFPLLNLYNLCFAIFLCQSFLFSF